MIPVPKELTQKIDIDPIKDTYLSNEYRFLMNIVTFVNIGWK